MKTAAFLAAKTKGPAMPERFRQLTVLEPLLAALWSDVAYYRAYWAKHPAMAARGREASWRGIKGELSRLVGPGREDRDDILGSSQAYDCAYRALLDALGA